MKKLLPLLALLFTITANADLIPNVSVIPLWHSDGDTGVAPEQLFQLEQNTAFCLDLNKRCSSSNRGEFGKDSAAITFSIVDGAVTGMSLTDGMFCGDPTVVENPTVTFLCIRNATKQRAHAMEFNVTGTDTLPPPVPSNIQFGQQAANPQTALTLTYDEPLDPSTPITYTVRHAPTIGELIGGGGSNFFLVGIEGMQQSGGGTVLSTASTFNADALTSVVAPLATQNPDTGVQIWKRVAPDAASAVPTLTGSTNDDHAQTWLVFADVDQIGGDISDSDSIVSNAVSGLVGTSLTLTGVANGYWVCGASRSQNAQPWTWNIGTQHFPHGVGGFAFSTASGTTTAGDFTVIATTPSAVTKVQVMACIVLADSGVPITIEVGPLNSATGTPPNIDIAATSNFTEDATVTLTTFDITGLTAATTKCIQVLAKDSASNVGLFSTAVCATTASAGTGATADAGPNDNLLRWVGGYETDHTYGATVACPPFSCKGNGPNGIITLETTNVRAGTNSAKIQLSYGADREDYHAQIRGLPGPVCLWTDASCWVGFSICLPNDNYVDDGLDGVWEIMMQFHGPFESQDESPLNPLSQMAGNGGTTWGSYYSFNPTDPTLRAVTTRIRPQYDDDIIEGEWNDFVYHFKLDKLTTTGFVHLWINKTADTDAKSVNLNNIGFGFNNVASPNVKYGLYKGWKANPPRAGAVSGELVTTRIIYWDTVRFGDDARSFADVTPPGNRATAVCN